MSRQITLYTDLYKDPERTREILARGPFKKLPDIPFSYSTFIVCSDMMGLCNSIVGANTHSFNDRLFGNGAVLEEKDCKVQYYTHKWNCFVFLGDKDAKHKLSFLRHRETGATSLIDKKFAPSEKNIIDGYTSGNKLKDAIDQDLASGECWGEYASVEMRDNTAVFFRADLFHKIPHSYFSDGLLQVFMFGDDNVD